MKTWVPFLIIIISSLFYGCLFTNNELERDYNQLLEEYKILEEEHEQLEEEYEEISSKAYAYEEELDSLERQLDNLFFDYVDETDYYEKLCEKYGYLTYDDAYTPNDLYQTENK